MKNGECRLQRNMQVRMFKPTMDNNEEVQAIVSLDVIDLKDVCRARGLTFLV